MRIMQKPKVVVAAAALAVLAISCGCGYGAVGPDARVIARTTGEHAGEADMVAFGDFNGDGASDTAYFVRTGDGYALAVSLAGANPMLVREVGSIANMGVRNAPPGKYIAACAKGHGDDCAGGELRELTTTRDSIVLFTYESASALYFFQDGRFELMWLSD